MTHSSNRAIEAIKIRHILHSHETMLQGKLARALSGEDHSFIGGRSNSTNSKTAAREKALLLEIDLWFKLVKTYSETNTGSNKPNR